VWPEDRVETVPRHGYRGHRTPFETAFGAYMAMVDDPDGNTVLMTAG